MLIADLAIFREWINNDQRATTPEGVLGISSDGDDQRIFGGLKFSIPGFFWVRKFGKYFFGYLDLSRDFLGVLKRIGSALAG